MNAWLIFSLAAGFGAVAVLLRFAHTKQAADTLLDKYEELLANPPKPKKK